MSFYYTQYGDSPARIAKKFGVTIPALLGANPQKKIVKVAGQYTWTSLIPNETITIPGIPTPGQAMNPEPVQATVVTHDPPPAGDLTIHVAPYGHTIGGIDKNGLVQVLQWNADGGNAWAKISWSGGRHPAIVGFANRKYLAPLGAPSPAEVAQTARYNPTTDTVTVGTSDSGTSIVDTQIAADKLALLQAQTLALLQKDGPYGDNLPPPDPTTASVTTHDKPPRGDLTVHSSPHGPVIGAADKDGIVTVLEWNGDGKHEWAKISWAGGRHPAVTGYANRKYLAGHTSSTTGVGDSRSAEEMAAAYAANGPAATPTQIPGATMNISSGGPLTATVTTHDQPPAGDLTVHSAPSPNSPVTGGIDKNGTVQILQWNADGNDGWARISWTGGRNAAATGYANRKYLTAGAYAPGPSLPAGITPVPAPQIPAATDTPPAPPTPSAPKGPLPGTTPGQAVAPGQEPGTAVVTTHDQPPAGDLTVHATPGGATKGAADKDGVVRVLQWNADGNNQWAQIAWDGPGRHDPVTGFSKRRYLAGGAPKPGAQQQAQAQAQNQPTPAPATPNNPLPGNLVTVPTEKGGFSQGAIVAAALGVAALVGVVGYAVAKGPSRGGSTKIVTRYRKKPVHHRKPSKSKKRK
jgi:hypothetical protein